MHQSIFIPPLRKSSSQHIYVYAAFIFSILIIVCQLDLADACSPDLNTCSHLYSHQHQKNSKHHSHHQHSSAYEHLFDHELTFESRYCFCDKYCKLYRDCCSDYDHVAPQENLKWKEPQLQKTQHANLLFDCNLYIHDKDATSPNFIVNGAFSINKCTVPETSDEQREIANKCVNDVIPVDTNFADLKALNAKLKEHDPLLLLPVTIKQHHASQPLTYRNIYCALCNNISLSIPELKRIEFWQLGASCVSESPQEEDTHDDGEHVERAPPAKDRNCVITYTRGQNKTMKSMNHNGIRKCKFAKDRCIEDRNTRKLGDPDFNFDLEELDSITRNCHSHQSLRYQDDLRFRNSYCGMCHNIGSSSLKCEPKNLIQDFKQFLANAPKKIDLSYENNRLLLNQSSYRAVLDAEYLLHRKTITFINHLDQQQSNAGESPNESGQTSGRSVKELTSFDHVLYWKGLPAEISSATCAGFRTLTLYLGTVFSLYLFL